VAVAVRPERVALHPRGSGRETGVPGWEATVQDATYKGATTAYALSLADGSRIVANVASSLTPLPLGVGSVVHVTIPPDALRILER
jgi:ABC-type Fe3+/spermidine/putrescine transport system ATPase subunit